MKKTAVAWAQIDNKDVYVQGLYGSDGTRTRDLRRDSYVSGLAGGARGSPLVAVQAVLARLELPLFAVGCRRCVP